MVVQTVQLPRRGILFMLLATLAFSIMNLLVKALEGVHPTQIVFLRAFGNFVCILPLMLHQGVSIVGKQPGWLLLRGLLGTLSLIAFFWALQRIPLGSAVSIRYLGPIFSAVIAIFWLRERITPLQWGCFLLAFLGVIMLKGFDLRIDTLSLGLLLFSAVTVGGVFVVIRFLTQSGEHFLTIINYFMVVAMVVSVCFCSQWRMLRWEEWLLALAITATGLAGQVFMTQAYETEEASTIAPFKYMELVWALVFGLLFFGETYTLLPLLGMLLILVGMIGNVLFKN